jgi:hypothetical protein
MLWAHAHDAIWRTAPGYLALASIDGSAIEIRGPACDIWKLLESPIEEAQLVATLSEQYAGDRVDMRRDVRQLLDDLHERGYVVRSV